MGGGIKYLLSYHVTKIESKDTKTSYQIKDGQQLISSNFLVPNLGFCFFF